MACGQADDALHGTPHMDAHHGQSMRLHWSTSPVRLSTHWQEERGEWVIIIIIIIIITEDNSERLTHTYTHRLDTLM